MLCYKSSKPTYNLKDMSNNPPVLIVGSGPTGLILALALIQNGITPRIIQKDLQFRIGQKGAAVMVMHAHKCLLVFNL